MQAELLKKCTDAGIRMTAQRSLIIETLLESDDHPDADRVYRRAVERDQSISLPTVYRALNLFEGAGIIKKSSFRTSAKRP